MKYENLIALRYVRNKKNVKFVSIISTISIVGVTIGVAALIIVLSVLNGFGGLVTSILVNFDPHVRIESTMAFDSTSYSDIKNYLDKQKMVKAYSPFVGGKALIVSKNINCVINIKGLDAQKSHLVSGVSEKIVLGKNALSEEKKNGILIGMILADRLGVVIGDTIAVISPSGAELAAMQFGLPLIRKFIIVGIYESNNKEYDGYYAFTSLAGAQSLFDSNNKINGIDLRLDNLDNANNFKNILEEKYGDNYRISTWYDLHKELYLVMQIERWGSYIVLCLIIAVASFNLLSSLMMTVIEKRRDIGILKSMGATNNSINKIFRLQGLFVGIIGTISGTILALIFIYLQKKYNFIELDTTIFIISTWPIEISYIDIIIVSITSIMLCLIASRFPAKRAALLDPVKAIRWE